MWSATVQRSGHAFGPLLGVLMWCGSAAGQASPSPSSPTTAPSPTPAPPQPAPAAPGASTPPTSPFTGQPYPTPAAPQPYDPRPFTGQPDTASGAPATPAPVGPPQVAPAPVGPAPFFYQQPEDPRPRYLAYRPGQPPPPDYRYEEQFRRGPIIAGSITLGVAYLLGLLVASEDNYGNKKGYLFLPTVGPWLTLLTRDSTCDPTEPISDCTEDKASRIGLVLGGVLQAGGTIFLAAGLLNPRKRYTRNDTTSLVITPSVARGHLGLSATSVF